MNAKDVLRSNKELTAWWAAVCRHENYRLLETFVKAHLTEQSMSAEEMKGANAALNALGAIIENESAGYEYPTPGIVQEIKNKEHEKESPSESN
jgi:hypothetical protein